MTNILVNKVGFRQLTLDECVLYCGNVLYVLYTDDYIILGIYPKERDKAVEDIKSAKLDITIEGDIQDFLGVNSDHKPDGTIHMTQPHLVDQILDNLKMGENVTPKPTSATSSKLLSRHSNSKNFDKKLNYR